MIISLSAYCEREIEYPVIRNYCSPFAIRRIQILIHLQIRYATSDCNLLNIDWTRKKVNFVEVFSGILPLLLFSRFMFDKFRRKLWDHLLKYLNCCNKFVEFMSRILKSEVIELEMKSMKSVRQEYKYKNA